MKKTFLSFTLILACVVASATETAVSNLTTKVDYATLADAVSAAVAGDTLQINEDVTISSNRLENTVALTIQGKTGTEKILRDVASDIITLLPKADLTLKNLVMDGQNVNRKKCAIEVGKVTVNFENVTIQNYKRTDSGQTQGIVTIKNGGKAIFTGVTLSSNEVLEGYGDVFVGVQKGLTLAGKNIIPNGAYLEKDSFAIVDNAATHTAAIDLIVIDARKLGEDYPIVSGTTDASKYNIVTSKDWSLAAGQDFLYVKDNTAALEENAASKMQNAKFFKDGKLYIRQGNVVYDVLGGKQ